MITLKVTEGFNTASLMAVSKLKFKLDKKKKALELPEIGFNSKVLIGLSRFKKKIGLRSSLESTPREEELDEDQNKMRFIIHSSYRYKSGNKYLPIFSALKA